MQRRRQDLARQLQERSESANPNPKPTGPFLIGLCPIPQGWTWKDLKDKSRVIVENPGWADALRISQAGVKSGRVTIKNDTDALNLYLHFIRYFVTRPELAQTRVHLSDTSVTPPKLLRSNCVAISAHCPTCNATSGSNESESQLATQLRSLSVHEYAQPSTSSFPSHGVTVNPALYSPAAPGFSAGASMYPPTVMGMMSPPPAAGPVYAQSSGGPVNISHGAIQTEKRSVHVRNLHYSVTKKDIVALLSKAGRVESCELHRSGHNSSGVQSKPWATALFASEAEARTAIERFGGKAVEFNRGLRLDLREDRNQPSIRMPSASSSTASPGREDLRIPLVVNGSTKKDLAQP